MSYLEYASLVVSSTLSLSSQILSFKCAEDGFKNPFLNGLQMMAMSFASRDLINDFKPTTLIIPIAYGLSTIIDDIFMSRGWTSKHYFTDITSIFDLSQKLKYNLLLKSSVEEKNIGVFAYCGSIGLFIVKYLQEAFSGSKGYIETMRTLQMKVAKNVADLSYVTDGKCDLKKFIAAQVITNEVLTRALEIPGNVETFTKLLSPIVTTIMGIAMPEIASSHLGNIVSSKNDKIIASPEALLKISSVSEHTEVLSDIDKLTNDITFLIRNLLAMQCSITTAIKPEVFSQNNLRSSFGELLNISDTVNTQIEIQEILSRMSMTKKILISSPRTIIERDGLNYFFDKNAKDSDELASLDKIVNPSNKITLGIFNAFETMIVAAIFNFNSVNKKLSELSQSDCYDLVGKIMPQIQAGSKLNSLILELPLTESKVASLKRLANLYRFLETVKSTSYVNYKSHDGNYLKFKDLTIDINGLNKVTIEDLTLESGNWYLLTGISGCGKSTYLTATYTLQNFAQNMKITGSIYYPKLSPSEGPKIYMLTQTNNFPYGVSLLENICYPMVTTEDERQSYKSLIEELMLKMEGCERNSIEGREYLEFGLLSRLDKRINDITSETSGGQQKKMSIAGLIVRIMKETGMLKSYNEAISLGLSHDKAMEEAKYSVGPVLVLIDETFNGLDSGANGGAFEYSSKGLVLKTLKASLPASAIVVSVEHQPQFDQYDARIHLNGDGTYIYSGNRATEVVPEETEDLEPLEGM